MSFARSVHDHDVTAFAEHVHPGAVFGEGDGVLLGRDAIVAGWEPLVRGTKLRLSWYPTSVMSTGDPHVVLSRGPYLIESMSHTASPHFLRGTFQSVWVRDADGRWRVLIDGGTPPPTPAPDAFVDAFRQATPPACPRPP